MLEDDELEAMGFDPETGDVLQPGDDLLDTQPFDPGTYEPFGIASRPFPEEGEA